MRWVVGTVLLLFAANQAHALEGTLQESISCPARNCTTVCYAASGTPKTTVTLYSRLDVYQQSASSPNKTWLQSDGKPHVIMLGDTYTCDFDGDALPISPPPIPPVNLDPPPRLPVAAPFASVFRAIRASLSAVRPGIDRAIVVTAIAVH